MRTRLPGHYYRALEIHGILSGHRLHQTVLDMVSFYNFNFGMVFPPLNHKLLLYKHIRDLGLPGMFLLLYFYLTLIFLS